MSEAAIILKNLSKKYKLFHSNKDRLKEALSFNTKQYHQEFWALKNVDLMIPKGKTVGIVGRNGSGKSTLLQLITSIIKPTSGEINVQGKTAALLELGTGFNPNFTGLQNIVLNCTLMGLKSKQIKDRIDTIQAFADIGEFIHQPLRTYSSGMKMRLGFATAINVDPDILIVDEALAVGDAKFQQKCYQKFIDFQNSGKTIILVTHDMQTIPRYCDFAVLLHDGHVVEVGAPEQIVSMYSELSLCGTLRAHRTDDQISEIQSSKGLAAIDDDNEINSFVKKDVTHDLMNSNPLYNANEYRFGDGRARIVDALLIDNNGQINPSLIASGATIELYIKVVFDKEVSSPLIGASIKTKDGVILYAINTRFLNINLPSAKPGDVKTYQFTFTLNISPGDWFFDLGLAEKLPINDMLCDVRNHSLHIQIERKKNYDGLVELPSQFKEITI